MKRKSLPTGRDFLFVEGYGNENPGAFQPTRPLRGATTAFIVELVLRLAISTHAPLAGRDPCSSLCRSQCNNFNPRAPCGARPNSDEDAAELLQFQPTRPLRGATIGFVIIRERQGISTHAPLAGRDALVASGRGDRKDFNPRAPCGARHRGLEVSGAQITISTHAPLAGRDQNDAREQGYGVISTHAPLAGRDEDQFVLEQGGEAFQPTRPLRGATAKVYKSLCTFLR